MKLITNEQNKEFVPFNITLRVKTLGEARLLWHVFNRGNLKNAIFENYWGGNYKECDEDFNNSFEIMNYIKDKIKPEVI